MNLPNKLTMLRIILIREPQEPTAAMASWGE